MKIKRFFWSLAASFLLLGLGSNFNPVKHTFGIKKAKADDGSCCLDFVSVCIVAGYPPIHNYYWSEGTTGCSY